MNAPSSTRTYKVLSCGQQHENDNGLLSIETKRKKKAQGPSLPLGKHATISYVTCNKEEKTPPPSRLFPVLACKPPTRTRGGGGGGGGGDGGRTRKLLRNGIIVHGDL